MGYFIGAFALVWLLAVLFTFIHKVVTKKKVTRRTVIITTIAATVFWLIDKLVVDVFRLVPEGPNVWGIYLAIIIATPAVLTVRLGRLKKKSKNIDTEAQGKNS